MGRCRLFRRDQKGKRGKAGLSLSAYSSSVKAETCLLSLWGRIREEGTQAMLLQSFYRLPDKVEGVVNAFCKQLELCCALSAQRLSAVQTSAGKASKLWEDNVGAS